ncbi:hypothetical protein VKI21_06945 [Cyanobacterium aponinum UTEX 3222]|uniref:hypothetical protein n=1 Tax=Cyanobacterium aponinum TaxID=379064 RepID=UPI003084EC0B|nr:hypothetical protein VKI21_06945 [Cyanobacterium aponinum UTEX 3222]
MALSDHKIPIITGKNDVPTTSESQENHPNGSFTTAKYNALIDELNNSIPKNPVGCTNVYPNNIYVNSDTGNDSTGDGTELNPFATIEKAIDQIDLNEIVGNLFIYTLGTFINPKLDFSKFKVLALTGSPVLDDYDPRVREDIFFYSVNIYGQDNTTIIFENNADLINYESTDTVYSHFVGKGLRISGCTIQIKGNEPFKLIDCSIYFHNVFFDCSQKNTINWHTMAIWLNNADVIFKDCSFKIDINLNYLVIESLLSHISIMGKRLGLPLFEQINGIGKFLRATRSNIYLDDSDLTNPSPITSASESNLIFVNLSDADSLTKWDIDSSNNVNFVKCSANAYSGDV